MSLTVRPAQRRAALGQPDPGRPGAHRFKVWAWGDAGLGDVRIVLPPHFIADVETVPRDADGRSPRRRWRPDRYIAETSTTRPLARPVEATNRDALTDVPSRPVANRWSSMPGRRTRSGSSAFDGARGKPARPRGRDRPAVAGGRTTLEVTEVTSSEIEGYAGLFDSATTRSRSARSSRTRHRPRGVARLVRRRPVPGALDRRGARRRVRRPDPGRRQPRRRPTTHRRRPDSAGLRPQHLGRRRRGSTTDTRRLRAVRLRRVVDGHAGDRRRVDRAGDARRVRGRRRADA